MGVAKVTYHALRKAPERATPLKRVEFGGYRAV